MNSVERANVQLLTEADRGVALRCAEAIGPVVGIPPALILGRSRVQEVTEARFAITLAMRRAGWTLGRIGRAMQRDWSSVRNGLNQAERWEGGDELFRNAVRHASSALGRQVLVEGGQSVEHAGPEARPERRPGYRLPPPLAVERTVR